MEFFEELMEFSEDSLEGLTFNDDILQHIDKLTLESDTDDTTPPHTAPHTH